MRDIDLHFDELILSDGTSAGGTESVGCKTRRDAIVAEQVSAWCDGEPCHRLKADDAGVIVVARVELLIGEWLKVWHGWAVLTHLCREVWQWIFETTDALCDVSPEQITTTTTVSQSTCGAVCRLTSPQLQRWQFFGTASKHTFSPNQSQSFSSSVHCVY